MNTTDVLNKEFFAQDFEEKQPYAEMLDRYKSIAHNYAQMENAIAVLSDLRNNSGYIFYGGFSKMLKTDNSGKCDRLSTIWEEDLFRLIHPDDLAGKHIQELCFFHFIKRQPKRKRTEYYLTSRLRMLDKSNNFIPALHRMFYIPNPSNNALWLALCLYSPLPLDMPAQCLIINSVNGQMRELTRQDKTKILSVREKQVLSLINKGLTSKDIAEMLCISRNTVNRHRQEILSKLQAKNSIEACRTAKDLNLI